MVVNVLAKENTPGQEKGSYDQCSIEAIICTPWKSSVLNQGLLR